MGRTHNARDERPGGPSAHERTPLTNTPRSGAARRARTPRDRALRRAASAAPAFCWAHLVDLDVPLARLLPLRELVLPAEALLLGNALKHLGDAGHHALEAAEVHVRAVVHAVEDLVGVLLHLVLDVHLAAVHVGLLARERVVETEVV